MAAEPPETPFATKKKFGGGKSQKIRQRVFLVGASTGLPGQSLELSLHDSASIALEIGSRFFVDCSQAV